ncbi:MAG: DUF368 domain-containing protein [Nitriliruptoraceae bacterium]
MDEQVELPEPLGPVGLVGSVVVGAAMGAAEVVPGFSGGTVALVAGIYERLIANVRQGARMLSLLLRGRFDAAWRALLAMQWLFLVALLVGMGTTIALVAGVLGRFIEQRPVEASAVFLGLVLGAAVVAAGQRRAPAAWHWLIVFGVAALTFLGLGVSSGTIETPSLLLLFVGVAVAVCAWILPGVSGAFLLLLVGLYPAVLAAVDQRDLAAIVVMALGALVGLAAFSTLLHWLLERAHDVVLAAMLGLMLGSTRVLWPWPSTDGMGDPALGLPEVGTAPLAIALVCGAFAAVWVVGLVADQLGTRSRAPVA